MHNISKRRSVLTVEVTKTLVQSLVISRLDYCNALLYGCDTTLLHRLQVQQNNAARLIFQLTRSSHVSSVLRDLHWLPVSQRIVFKIAVIVFKCINGLSPCYLSQELVLRNPPGGLRASSNVLLYRPRVRRNYGIHSFNRSGPDP